MPHPEMAGTQIKAVTTGIMTDHSADILDVTALICVQLIAASTISAYPHDPNDRRAR